jgi:hypothetical protein
MPQSNDDALLGRGLNSEQKSDLIRDVYRKHAEELRAIEDAQVKLTTLLLGIFGAGATFLGAIGGKNDSMPVIACIGLTIVAVAIIQTGTKSTAHRDNARKTTRDLLVRSEKALGLFEPGVFIANEPLYQEHLANYSARGWWLGEINNLVKLAGFGFIILVWSGHLSAWLVRFYLAAR